MKSKIVKIFFLLIGFFLIYTVVFFHGSHVHKIVKEPNGVYSPFSSDTKLTKNLGSIQRQELESFSVAHNSTHLWSMRYADENYYRIARFIPCRTVEYTGGPSGQKIDTMNSCGESTISEYSVEATLFAQKWLYEHQNPADCSNKKFAIIHQYAWSGFGSTIHQILWAFGRALADDRIAVYQTPGNWLYGTCSLGTPDCIFLPISNCSVPSTVDDVQTIRIRADTDHWSKPVHPPVFQNRSFNWYRSQLIFYLMRFNVQTLAHVQGTVAQYFNPPSVDVHRPYISIYIRRSDKVQNREMSQAYTLQQYVKLFDDDAVKANITTVYINSEDGKVFDEFSRLNSNIQRKYKLLSINATRNIVFMTMVRMPVNERGKIVLEFLTDLFIEANADLHVGTLTSNWCRVVDEIRLALGKMIPYYTPEDRFIIDV